MESIHLDPLLLIIRKLSHQDILSLRSICKFIRSVVDSHIFKLEISIFIAQQSINQLTFLNQIPNSHIRLRFLNFSLQLHNVLDYVKELNLHSCTASVSDDYLSLLPHQLQVLNISSCSRVSNTGIQHLSQLSSLRRLDISNLHRLSDIALTYLPTSLNHLCLSISSFSNQINANSLCSLACLNLTDIHLYTSCQINFKDLPTSITRLQMSLSSVFPLPSMQFDGMPNLKVFSLTPDSISFFHANDPISWYLSSSLLHLTIRSISNSNLMNLPHLRGLHVELIDNQLDLPSHLPPLQELLIDRFTSSSTLNQLALIIPSTLEVLSIPESSRSFMNSIPCTNLRKLSITPSRSSQDISFKRFRKLQELYLM